MLLLLMHVKAESKSIAHRVGSYMSFVGGREGAGGGAIRPEHMVEFGKALGGGQRGAGIDGSQRPANQLAIVPNTTQYTIPVEPMLPEIVGRFLGAASKAVG
jgi:hypothetical protein